MRLNALFVYQLLINNGGSRNLDYMGMSGFRVPLLGRKNYYG